jgi:O-succinylbenzoic acid--CoA ligase
MEWKKYTDHIQLNGKYQSIKELDCFQNPFLPKWEQEFCDFLKIWMSEDENISVKTSGSTGKPKSIEIHKNTLMQSALNTAKFFDLKKNNDALLCLPASYIAGKMMMIRALVTGMNLYLQKPSSTPLIKKQYDFCAMTPMQLENILKSNKNSLNNLKTLIIGGAPVNEYISKEIDGLETKIYETFGMTETASHIALKKINGKDKSDYFTVLDNIGIDINQDSCLILKKSNLGVGTIETNDIIELKDKKHFKWLGRKDNIINSGGIKLIPEQIEKKLKPFIENDFFIFSIIDKKYGQLPAIIIEGNHNLKGKPDFSILNRYETPKKIYYSDKFIKTSSGKINRKETLRILGFLS